jgi:hypothetical protein
MSITGALHAGKQTLEDMIRPVKAEYECICFRAGGFYAQPSHKVIPAMKKAGLKVDSSVVRGYRRTTPFDVDYSNVQTDNGSWWTTDTELVAEGTPGENILEQLQAGGVPGRHAATANGEGIGERQCTCQRQPDQLHSVRGDVPAADDGEVCLSA